MFFFFLHDAYGKTNYIIRAAN